jgi:hypothetical protein
MSKEDDDDIVIQGDVGETAQLKEEEKQAKKHDEEEHVEVAEGQELEVIPKNEEEEQQDILLTEAISITPKRPKVAKTKASVRNQHKEKTLANISEQLQKQSAKIDKVGQMLQPLQKYLKSANKQTDLIKELQTHIKQLQKQLSQVKKGIERSRIKMKNKVK